MSGIVGILNLDAAPIDRTLLARLTNSLLFRGPDAQRIWCRGQIGFGHTLLQTAAESKDERQPLSIDGNSCIVADVRIDGRRKLIAKLESHAHRHLDHVPDSELILRAYQVWDENCLDHLIGDFAFAVWNARKRRLFCARDHFGMKPFFYARVGESLIFSNTMDCLRRHPLVSERINELAIADFLLYDNNQDAGTTSFADILRLPPAHTLQCQSGEITTRRYWRLPEFAPVEHTDPRECLAQFREIFDAAVSDRLRSDNFRRLFQQRKFGRLFRDVAGFLASEGRFSRLYVRTRLRHWFGKQQINSEMPQWLRPEFVKRLGLRERWHDLDVAPPENRSTRPEAHAIVSSLYWTHNFEPFDPAILGINIESCHPFFDLRVLAFLLSLPALPWCSDKELLRQVERGVLPDAVRLRKKSPLISDPIVALLQKPESAWVDTFEAAPELHEYAQRGRIPAVYRTSDPGQAWTHLKPLSLSLWLQRRALLDHQPPKQSLPEYQGVHEAEA